MARPVIEAVTAATLPEFAAFLHQHLDARRSTAQWVQGLSHHWMPDAPNHGFVVRDGGNIVGGIGACYAERRIQGRLERFCNITSWCVLDSHRQQSMRLAMALVGQSGFHFTDFSPTKIVSSTLQFLKFKPLDERQVVTLNLPWPVMDGLRIVSRPAEIEQSLQGDARQIYLHHAAFPWLQHRLLGDGQVWCHVIYRRKSFKGLPAAFIVHASDAAMLVRGWRRLCRHLLYQGIASTHAEHRLLQCQPWPSWVRSGFNAKVYLSPTFGPEQIDYLYSEQVALDL